MALLRKDYINIILKNCVHGTTRLAHFARQLLSDHLMQPARINLLAVTSALGNKQSHNVSCTVVDGVAV